MAAALAHWRPPPVGRLPPRRDQFQLAPAPSAAGVPRPGPRRGAYVGAIPAPICCLLALAGARSQARRAERVRRWGRSHASVGKGRFGGFEPYEPFNDSDYEDGITKEKDALRRVDIGSVRLVQRSLYLSQCPHESARKPEIALFGRSNVGKSSLLNYLCNNSKLATTGRRPGHTKVVHHYLVDGEWYLVDLPGVGFIQASSSRVKNTRRIVSAYVRHRRTLVEILYLVDATVKVQEVDIHAVKWLMDAGVYLSVVFTKTDKKIRDDDVREKGIVEAFVEELMAMDESPWRMGVRPLPKFFLTSAKEKVGRKPLLEHIADIRSRAKPRVIAARDERERAKAARKRIEEGELLKDVKKETRLPAKLLAVPPPGIR